MALPFSTIDWSIEDGVAQIPIEERSSEEVREITGLTAEGEVASVALFDAASPAANPAFDVTPSRYVTRLVTEHGVCRASRAGLAALRASAPTSD